MADIVMWDHVTVTAGPFAYPAVYGQVLPDPAGDTETAERAVLRDAGAVRGVSVTSDLGDFTAAVLAAAMAEAAAEAAARHLPAPPAPRVTIAGTTYAYVPLPH